MSGDPVGKVRVLFVRVAHRVVGAITHARVHVTVVRVSVTVAGNTSAIAHVMIISYLTGLAVLSFVSNRTFTFLNP